MTNKQHVRNWIDSYIQATDNTEAPRLFREWAAVLCVSSALQRRHWLVWDRDIFPNLYVFIIGPAGARKGVSVHLAYKLLKDLGVHVASDSVTPQQFAVEFAAATDTFEYKGKSYRHSSFTLFSKEIAVVLNDENRVLFPLLLSWYDTEDEFKRSTKHSGSFNIEGVWLTMVGLLTPDLFHKTLPADAKGSGFLSRLIIVYQPRKGKIVVFPQPVPEDIYSSLLRGLRQIMSLPPGPYIYDETFVEPYRDWRLTSESEQKFVGTPLENYSERRATHLLKLCMIINAARKDKAKVITGQDLELAIDLLHRTEHFMLGPFEGYGSDPLAELTHKVVRILATKRKVYVHDLMNMLHGEANTETLRSVLATLLMSKKIEIPKSTGTKAADKIIIYKGD